MLGGNHTTEHAAPDSEPQPGARQGDAGHLSSGVSRLPVRQTIHAASKRDRALTVIRKARGNIQ